MTRPRASLALLAGAIAAVFAASSTFAMDDAEKARCRARYDTLNRYEFSGGSRRDSGVKLRSEIAKGECESGETGNGISTLEEELHRALLPLPQSK